MQLKDSKMELQKITSKTSLINMMILRAWKERWTEYQFGINIKTVLPRGVSGDVYNLADCLLQQALNGPTANPLILHYLKYSLFAYLVSHAAVIKRISKYEHFERIFCISSLLEFLEGIIDSVTCRTKPEEFLLPSALLSLVNWLFNICTIVMEQYELQGEIDAERAYMFDKACIVIEKLANQQFTLGILYVGAQEDAELVSKVRDKYLSIKMSLNNTNYTPQNPMFENDLHKLAHIDLTQLKLTQHLDPAAKSVEQLTYCVQPLIAVEVLQNPCKDTAYYVAQLQVIQRLKNYSNTRLFYEIIRAGFISLSNVVETNHDTMWGAFTFFKVPHIIKQLHALSRASGAQTPSDYIPEVVQAFEMLLEDNLLLDLMDTKCSCNIIEYLLNDWTKQNLVNDMHVKHFAAQRENISTILQTRESGNQAPSIINFVIRAEVPLSGILKTLSADYNKVQEALLGVLGQVLVGNSFALILSVATVEGRLKTFVSRLIQCNENSKQIIGEVGKSSVIRSTLFDVSFLMLTFIVQTYGSNAVLSENGDSFFERWARNFMVERNKPKNPSNMISICDENIVDELLLSLTKPEAQIKNSNLTWQDICMNLPGVLHHVLIAWENESLSSTDVKGILDNIRRRLCSFSVCATTYLCAYMFSVRENEHLKPLNMIQQFLAPPSVDEVSSQENIKERLGLSFQIIRKMQQDVHPSGNLKTRNTSYAQNLVSNMPLVDHFQDVWRKVAEHGWLPVRAAQVLQTLLHSGGPNWLTYQLVEEVLKCKYLKDMQKTMDIVFAILHLDIERNTAELLESIVPLMLYHRQGEDINEPQCLILARLCVYCIISALEAQKQTNQAASAANKKRTRSLDSEDMELGQAANTAKMRKLAGCVGGGIDGNSDNSCSNDFLSDSQLILSMNSGGAAGAVDANKMLQEPLHSALQSIFNIFLQFVSTGEISPKIYFIYQFISLLVECGNERVRPVLALMPASLIQKLIKVMLTDDVSVGLISRLYDLKTPNGRQAAVADLCLWRYFQNSRNSIVLC